jgi:hypothetical protein
MRAVFLAISVGCWLSGCADPQVIAGVPTPPPDAEAQKIALAARRAECQRLYNLLGDRSLTSQQVEAIRVSMNARFCAGLAP